MTKIVPFKAIRACRDKAHLVATRSYLTYSASTLKEKLNNNPFTFLHVINPNNNENKKINFTEKCKLVRKKLNDFIKSKYLIKDKQKSFYIYQQTDKEKSYIGIIAGISIEDYNNNIIKIHEETIAERENLFKKYLDITNFNADPVLLTYKKNININNIINKVQRSRAEYEFTTTDKILHKLWLVNNLKDINNLILEFKKINNIYIADGHHRTASSSLLHKKIKKTEKNNCNYFMSYLISEDQISIRNFNRLITLKRNLNKNNLLNKIKDDFNIINTKYRKPNKQNEIGMYYENKYYLLIPKSKIISKNPLERLDPYILSQKILKPILRIKNERTNKSISFLSGKISFDEIKKMADKKQNSIVFILQPVTINNIKEVADNNKIMPPKSTYIEPKLRSGLIIYPIK